MEYHRVTKKLKQPRRQRQRKRHLKINIWEMVTVFFIPSSSHPLLLKEHAAKWTGRSAVELNVEDERFTVMWSRCCYNVKSGNSRSRLADYVKSIY